MDIKTQDQARRHAELQLKGFSGELKNLLVSEDGSVHANGDLDVLIKSLDDAGLKYFILKQEQKKLVQEQKKQPKQ